MPKALLARLSSAFNMEALHLNPTASATTDV
jgi:hypothetical protein